jgi:hypothetical protein
MLNELEEQDLFKLLNLHMSWLGMLKDYEYLGNSLGSRDATREAFQKD